MVFGVPFLITAALQFTVPLSLPRGSLTPAIPPAGIVLILVGSVLIILARRELLKHNRPIRETQPASWSPPVFSLFQGILSTSTKFVFVVGIELALGLAWVLVRLLPALIACPYILIVLEEQYPRENSGRNIIPTPHQSIDGLATPDRENLNSICSILELPIGDILTDLFR